MSPSFKKITILFVLTSFLVLVFFGVFTMIHESDGQMKGDCPFLPIETVNCLQDTITAVFHYISSYQSFLNTQVGSNVTLGLISLLLLVLVFVMYLKDFSFLNGPLYFNRCYDSPPLLSGTRKIIRWLSLFEHSPSIT